MDTTKKNPSQMTTLNRANVNYASPNDQVFFADDGDNELLYSKRLEEELSRPVVLKNVDF